MSSGGWSSKGFQFFSLRLQLEPVQKKTMSFVPFLRHNMKVIKSIPGGSYTIYHHGLDRLSQDRLHKFFFGDEDRYFPTFEPLRNAVGELFWQEACEPLLAHDKFKQSTNPHLQLVRARAAAVSDQCRYHILELKARFGAKPVVYLDIDAIVSPDFLANYKKYRDTHIRQQALLIATYGRGSGSMQIKHFSNEYQHGCYKVKELALNTSVLLAEPQDMTDADFIVLGALKIAFANVAKLARQGKVIEWSTGLKTAAAALDDLPMPAGLAPPYLFHPISTRESFKDITRSLQLSLTVSLSGTLDIRYGQQVLNAFNGNDSRERSRSPRRGATRVDASSCPPKWKSTWDKIMQRKLALPECDISALDIRACRKTKGRRSGLKSASLQGVQMVHNRLVQKRDKAPRKVGRTAPRPR